MTKNLCIIQARMGSTRLPGKVLLEVLGKPLLVHEIDRVRLAKKIHKIVVATTDDSADDKIEELCVKIGVECFRGSKDDVLKRYYDCSLAYPDYDNIIRITGDCPVVDPKVIDDVVDFFEKSDHDYASNILKESYPDGLDVEVISKNLLNDMNAKATLKSEREHVTTYVRLRETNYKKGNLEAPKDYSKFRFTVDNAEDIDVVKYLLENLEPGSGYLQCVELMDKRPEIFLKNANIKRNEGLLKSLEEDKKS